MVEITDKNLKVGDVTIEYRFDAKLIKSLLNLENGKIVPDKEAIMRKELIGEFLSDFIYLPDVLLHHDRLVLPRSKAFYVKRIGDEVLYSSVIEKLEKAEILYFPPREAYDIGKAKKTHKELIDLASRDPRVRLLALLSAPDNRLNIRWLKEHNFVDKDRVFKRYWAGGSDDIVQWLDTVNLNQMYATIPNNATNDPILSRRRVEGSPGYSVFLTSNIPVIEGGYYSQDFKFFDDIVKEKYRQKCGLLAKEIQKRLEKPTESALYRVLSKLSETKESIEKDLIEEEWMTEKQTYKIPFSFGLLINEMNRKSDPIDLIDVAIKKRKERGNKAFRKWLREYDTEMRKDNPDREKLKKIKEDLDQVAKDLQKDSSCRISNEKTVHSLSNLGTKIAEIVIRLLGDISSVKEISNVIINSLGLLYPNLRFPHRAYMQKLGTADIKVLDKLELDRVFGEQGKKFASILRYYSAVGKKADTILKMKKT